MATHYDGFCRPTQFRAGQTTVVGHGHLRLEPEFGIATSARNVNVRKLARRAFVRKEVEAEAADSENDRHS